MSDIKVFEREKIVRKQILVIDCGGSLSPEERQLLRQGMLKQMQSGLIILPNGCKAITCDADAVMVKNEVIECGLK